MDKILAPIKQRILQFVDYKQIERKNFFGELNVATSNFRGNALYSEVGGDVIAKILSSHPKLNAEWLLTGNGEMLKSEEATELIKTPPRVEIIEPIKVEGRNLMPKVVVVDDEDNDRIPLVSVKAQAGYLEGYEDCNYIEELPTYSLPEMRNGTFRMFQVNGFSMYPTLQDGSYVIGEFVENWEWLSDNRVCVVVTERDGVIVKRVINRAKERGFLYCKSDNRDYKHIKVMLEDVKEIWECKAHISFEFLDPITNYQKIAELEVNVSELQDKIKQLETQLLPEST
ncbi:S24 family peptidase [uncultured Capnocytophaga sp.]|uniref:S24 family peptidase n=1 Tax=uncultured Capnocytophaga sp. TaxID=159273 RepID=UPI0025934E44|nr:S24 family peptidase [uncultured Capnocytophaga sp.]